MTSTCHPPTPQAEGPGGAAKQSTGPSRHKGGSPETACLSVGAEPGHCARKEGTRVRDLGRQALYRGVGHGSPVPLRHAGFVGAASVSPVGTSEAPTGPRAWLFSVRPETARRPPTHCPAWGGQCIGFWQTPWREGLGWLWGTSENSHPSVCLPSTADAKSPLSRTGPPSCPIAWGQGQSHPPLLASVSPSGRPLPSALVPGLPTTGTTLGPRQLSGCREPKRGLQQRQD